MVKQHIYNALPLTTWTAIFLLRFPGWHLSWITMPMPPNTLINNIFVFTFLGWSMTQSNDNDQWHMMFRISPKTPFSVYVWRLQVSTSHLCKFHIKPRLASKLGVWILLSGVKLRFKVSIEKLSTASVKLWTHIILQILPYFDSAPF